MNSPARDETGKVGEYGSETRDMTASAGTSSEETTAGHDKSPGVRRGAVGNLADLNEEDGTGELVDNHSSIDGGSSAAGRSESVEDAQLLEHIDLSDDGREVRFSRYNNPTPCGDTTAESEGNAGPNGTNTSLDTEASRRNTLQKESAQPPLGSDGSSTLAVDGSSGASCLHGNDGNCDANNSERGQVDTGTGKEGGEGALDTQQQQQQRRRRRRRPQEDGGEDDCSGHSGDSLPAQLKRLWGGSLPAQSAGLAIVRDIFACRQELDGMLSTLAARENTYHSEAFTRQNRGESADTSIIDQPEAVSSDSRPFTLSIMQDRFAPVVCDSAELRERAAARVRVVTAAGLRLGLVKRVFAREPWLPSEVEVEEEEDSRRPEGSSPSAVDIDSLLALVVPSTSASTAPETAPEELIRYPSTLRLTNMMWCQEDEDDEAEGAHHGASTDRGDRFSASELIPVEERLRFSIQTLDGEIYEDRDGGDDSSTASTACTAPSSLSLSSPPSCDSDFSFSGNLSEEEDEEEGDAHFKDASCGPFPPDGDTAAESLSSSSKKRKPISSETGVEREKLKLGRGCRLSDNIGDNISDDSKQSTKVGHIFTAVPDEEQTLNEVLYEHSDDLQSPHRRVAAVGPDGIDLSTHTRGKLRGETLPGWDTGAGTSRPSRRTHNNKRRRDESKLRRQREQDEQGGDYWDRKRALDSTLRTTRAAVRGMDCTLDAATVRRTAKKMLKIAALTVTKTAKAATAQAVRGVVRGLGDNNRITLGSADGSRSKPRLQRGWSGWGERPDRPARRGGRRVIVYVGVRRWGKGYFGPGFAVETQEKYRLGWLRVSQTPAGVTGSVEGGEPARSVPAMSRPARRRRGFFRLGRTGVDTEVAENREDVEGWVGSLTCNYCGGHPLLLSTAPSRTPSKRRNVLFSQAVERVEEENDVFCDAQESEGQGSQVVTPQNQEGEPKAQQTGQHEPEKAAQSQVHPQREAATQLGTRERGGRGNSGMEWCAGHVCLRLRPDGLRERCEEENRGEGGGEDEGRASEISGEGSEGQASVSGEEEDSGSGGGASSSREVPGRAGEANEEQRPYSSSFSVTGGGLARGRRKTAVFCGVSSEPNSKSTAAFAWGDNTVGCLGLPAAGSSAVAAAMQPVPVEPVGMLPGERIVAVACSERHTLLVTSMGCVYSAGEGIDGALGHGRQENIADFRLVEWFAQQMPPPRLREASAGSDLIGCHSAVLDVEGRLFTWGVGVAAGHGSARLVVVPTEVKDLEGGAREGGRRSGGTSKDRVKGVSCGGGFTLAVTNGGKVFSWGSWARGRLGLGRPPERTTGRHKRVPRFQAKPRRIVSIGKSPVVQVAAGDWHGMALTAEGEVYTWGHNASGQLGFLVPPSPATIKATPTVAIHNTTINSTSVSDMLRSSWTPVKLPQFGNQTASPKVPLGCTARDIPPATGRGFKETPTGGRAHESVESHCAVHIACGSQHSIVVDSLGAAWTWGGEGRSFLGHGETGIGSDYGGERAKAEAQARAMGSSGGSDPVKDSAGRPQHSTPSSFVPLSRERDISRSTARRALVGGWAEPRPISCLAQPQPTASALIVAAAAGRSHTILMTAEGRMFVFGEGAAVAGASPSTLNSVLGVEGKETGGGAAGGDDGVRGLVKRSAEEGAEDPLEILSAVAGPTPVPREACCSWLPALATRRIGAVACGGTHTIVLLAGDHIGYSLGMNCFRHAMGAERRRLDTSDILEREEEVEDSADGWGDGGVDCELLVAGSYLHAHRVILARRSPVLRDMIAQEERPGDGEPLQLLLPDLRVDVARALLEFLYTGDLRRPLDLDSALPYDLRAAARSYGIPRLEALCAEAISLGSDPDRQQGGREWGESIPPPTLAHDLGGALGSMEHADVKFLAGGKPIYAHRSVLACQSEYFAAMFRFRDQMGSARGKQPLVRAPSDGSASMMAEIVVPDSYLGFVRLLIFLYTGVLPDSSPESVLEDLLAADRYRLLEMKRTCQSLLSLRADNCLATLQTTDMVHAPVLREAALFYAECNLPEISQQKGFQDTMAGSLDFAQALLARLKATAARAVAAGTISARANQPRTQANANAGEKRGNDDDDNDDKTFCPDSPFPWHAAGVACACGGVYYKFSTVVAVGMFVPILNGVFFVGLAVFAFQKLRASRDLFERPTQRGAAHKYRAGRGGGRGGYGDARRGSRKQYAKRQGNTYLFG